jgi:hypothetical protein
MEFSLGVGKLWKLLWCGDAHVIHRQEGGGRPASYPKGRMEVRNRDFVRSRHFPDASPLWQLRFWSDVGFVALYDMCSFVVRPWRGGLLAHAVGVVSGAISCLLSPPSHVEPTPERQYFVNWGDLPPCNYPVGGPS